MENSKQTTKNLLSLSKEKQLQIVNLNNSIETLQKERDTFLEERKVLNKKLEEQIINVILEKESEITTFLNESTSTHPLMRSEFKKEYAPETMKAYLIFCIHLLTTERSIRIILPKTAPMDKIIEAFGEVCVEFEMLDHLVHWHFGIYGKDKEEEAKYVSYELSFSKI